MVEGGRSNKWFEKVVQSWRWYPEFKLRYINELKDNPAFHQLKATVDEQLKTQNVILLYSAKDTEHNQAIVLKELLTK